MFKRIDHVEIVPSDFDKTVAFYTDVLGFKTKMRLAFDRPPVKELAFVELGGTMIEFFRVDNPKAAAAEWQVGCRRICLEVTDMDKALEFLKSKGVEILSGPIASPTSKRAEIKDPSGISIELRQILGG